MTKLDEIKARYQELLAIDTATYKPDMAWLIGAIDQIERERISSVELVADVRHALGETDKELVDAKEELAKIKESGSKSLIFAAKIGMEKAAKIAEERNHSEIAVAIRSKIGKSS